MSDRTPELEPCPCCGSAAIYVRTGWPWWRYWHVRCVTIYCAMRTRDCRAFGDDDTAKGTARWIWSRRADDERVVELAAALNMLMLDVGGYWEQFSVELRELYGNTNYAVVDHHLTVARAAITKHKGATHD